MSEYSSHGPAYSGSVSTAVDLVTFGVPQAIVDGARGFRIHNHSANVVYFLAGPPASPPAPPYTKREVLGVGLVEDLPGDTPVATGGSEHGERIPAGGSVFIGGRLNTRRLKLAAASASRITVVPSE